MRYVQIYPDEYKYPLLSEFLLLTCNSIITLLLTITSCYKIILGLQPEILVLTVIQDNKLLSVYCIGFNLTSAVKGYSKPNR